MSDLRIDAMVPGLSNDAGGAAARAEELGSTASGRPRWITTPSFRIP
ncbi:hypothetical protein [Natrinema sp. SYSU A 869]|nr:hypothetical protein [Natrinema sp. SYSU A 869]